MSDLVLSSFCYTLGVLKQTPMDKKTPPVDGLTGVCGGHFHVYIAVPRVWPWKPCAWISGVAMATKPCFDLIPSLLCSLMQSF